MNNVVRMAKQSTDFVGKKRNCFLTIQYAGPKVIISQHRDYGQSAAGTHSSQTLETLCFEVGDDVASIFRGVPPTYIFSSRQI